MTTDGAYSIDVGLRLLAVTINGGTINNDDYIFSSYLEYDVYKRARL